MPTRYPLDNTGRSKEKAMSRSWMYRTYAEITGATALPLDMQYWCLAGRLVDETETRLQPLCEPRQAIAEGVIRAEQYIGVESDLTRAALNAKQTELPLTLIASDIALALRDYRHRGQLRPGLINLDTAHEPRLAVALLTRVYRELRIIEEGLSCVIFLNVLMERYRRYNDDILVEHLGRVPMLAGDEHRAGMLTSGWHMLAQTHEYVGSGTASRSQMKIYSLFRGYETTAEVRAVEYDDDILA